MLVPVTTTSVNSADVPVAAALDALACVCAVAPRLNNAAFIAASVTPTSLKALFLSIIPPKTGPRPRHQHLD
jgi:hypothetical protein